MTRPQSASRVLVGERHYHIRESEVGVLLALLHNRPRSLLQPRRYSPSSQKLFFQAAINAVSPSRSAPSWTKLAVAHDIYEFGSGSKSQTVLAGQEGACEVGPLVPVESIRAWRSDES